MKLERTDMGHATILRLEGDIDETGVELLRETMLECIADGRFNLVMNFSEVRFVSYMGVGVLVERLRKLRAFKGDIKLVGVNMYTERLFRMIGVSSLFEIYDSESQAVAVYQEAA